MPSEKKSIVYNMNGNNNHVLITGCSSGIGAALTQIYLNQGCRVSGFSRRPVDLSHPSFYHVICDVGNSESIKSSTQKVMNRWGIPEILINNAGVGYFGFLENLSEEQWKEMFSVNIFAIIELCRIVIPGMKQKGKGHIVNIASTAGLEGMAQVSAYASTKWAVRGLSESLWRECRDEGIKVTCVYPGAVKTEFFKNSPGIQPHDYMLDPKEVGQSIYELTQSTANFHPVNFEIRPLRPKGLKNK